MHFRQTALPDDLQYVMDCAIECDEVNAFDYAVVSLFGETKHVDQIWNGPRQGQGRGWRHGRGLICLEVDAYAHKVAQTLSGDEQKALFAFNLNAEPKKLLDCANYLAECNFVDETVGGNLKAFRNVRKCDRNYGPTKALARHLHSPKAILRYVKMADESVPHYRALNSGLRRLPWPSSVSEGAEIFEWMAEQREDIRRRQRAAEQRFADSLLIERGVRCKPPIPKKVRRMMTRAAELAATVVGPTETLAFIRGNPVEIRGETTVFEAVRRSSLSKNGHGAMSVDLKSLEGKRLASLCVYFDGMPALDQLAALKMHVDSGDEETILAKGNLFAITEDGMNHPVVLSHKKELSRIIEGRNDHQLRDAAFQQYWEATKPYYIAAVMQQVWGRDAKRVSEIFRAAQK